VKKDAKNELFFCLFLRLKNVDIGAFWLLL